MLRSLGLLAVVFGLLPLAFISPFVGVLLWTWVSLMSPQEFAWGMLAGLRWGVYIGAATVVTWIFSRDRKTIPMTATTVLLILFAIWMTITTNFALVPDAAWEKWDYVIRVVIQVIITSALLTNRTRLHALMWMIVISIGFYGVKGGGFVLLTGGQWDVEGPDSTGLTDRNHLALALVMTLPLINYLRQQSENVWIQRGLLVAAALDVFAIVGTYSRGGLLALAATLGVMFIRARGKLLMALFVVLAAPAAFYFMPDEWWARMSSIQDYQEDDSAQSRLAIWAVCLRIGLSSIFGGGFLANVYGNVVWQFDPTVAPRAAHSIFMEVLAEQGVIGLAIWSALMLVGLLNARWLVKAAKGRPELAWVSDLARMSQASLIGYFVAGAFLSLGYWIQELLLLVILCGARRLVTAELRASRKQAAAPGLLGIPAPSAAAR